MSHLLLLWSTSLHLQLGLQGLHLLWSLNLRLSTLRLHRWSLSKQLFTRLMRSKQCRDDFEELCYVARTSRKRIWRRVWHSRSTPLDASKSERSWRRLSKRLCSEEGFDEMKLTCAYCGMFDDEDDILVRCQGPDCSLRSADYDVPGVFHGRCAAASGPLGRCTMAELSMVPANNISCKACLQ